MVVDRERYNQLFYAVLHSSEALISDKDEHEVMNDVLSVLGPAADVDRVYIFRSSFENGEYAYLHYDYEWVKKGVVAHLGSDLLSAVPWSEFEWMKEILLSGSSYSVNVNELEPGEFKETLEVQDIKSVLFTPIIFDSKLWGFIGFDDCTNYRTWLDMEVSTLLAISANIGAFVKRAELAIQVNKQYQAMNRQKEFYETIFNNIPADIVAFDKNHKYLFLNAYAVRNKEVRDWLIGKDDFEYCEARNKPKDIAISRREHFKKIVENKIPQQFEEKMNQANGKNTFHMRAMHPVLNEYDEVDLVIGYGIDITTIKEQEDIILRQNEAIINSPDGIALLDNNGLYTYMNPAHETIFEYGKGALIGKHWQQLYEPEELEYISQTVFPVLQKKGIWGGQVKAKTKNGKDVFQDLTLRLLPDGSLVCITRDVSELVQNVRLLKETNQKLELAINTTKLGFYEWDMINDELISNDIFNEILGFNNVEKHTHVANDWFSAIHPDDADLVQEALDKQFATKEGENLNNYSIEYRIKNSNGEYIWVLDIGKVSKFSEEGKPTYMVGFMVDISSNKSIEEKIRFSEKRYRDLVENLREIIFETDADANFTFLNPAWNKLTGYSLEESLGKTFVDFYYPEIKYLEESFSKYDMLKRQPEYLHLEMPLQHKNGSLLWFDVEINKIFNESGELKATVGSIEDITKRKLAEEELRQALAKEKQLGDLKSRFVGMASHEFRTPLAGIRSSAELIMLHMRKSGVDLPEKLVTGISGKIDNIVFDVDRITGLMTDVLTMGSIESQKITFQPSSDNIVAFTEKYVQAEAQRYLSGHTLKYETNVDSCMVMFDPKLVLHVFNNMISNAAKYAAPNTEITVKVRKRKKDIQIMFKDQGIGIPSKELPFIFDSFFRSSNVENIPGTGLGLSIAKYFIDLHKGTIEIESEVNQGTIVILGFPIEK
ncbi:MAG: PAS domain S-box protein [Bacteroidia bacterium]|nr:PAS domain S-box protein [Bacteroidia bacterium]